MPYTKIKVYILLLIMGLGIIIFNPQYGFIFSLFLTLTNLNAKTFKVLRKWVLFSLYVVLFYYIIVGKSGLHYALRLLGYVLIFQWFFGSISLSEFINYISKYNKDLGVGIWITLYTLNNAKRKYISIRNAQISRGLNTTGLRNKFRGYMSIIIPLVISLYDSAIKRAVALSSRGYK
ncbi:energy-coupling factor transporter transmembrane component T [Methanotorris formicicus]|uniref:Cobalt transport protein n=1 Tax=Methanotorris formicicus Mc-S-70 TaxID=647171 RepID=H1KXN9_9EURY|nr:energy-coupling factor transporter transmembrane component T [Methanotorris formicicus]EHP88112.1 cobalt transport protein [Methanotorris formicicus Mc-S-70]